MLWSLFTCIEFSCKLRYRVLFDILSGTSSKFRLVQITRLAWLEQLHSVGQVEAAPTASWPGRMSRNSSWTNKRRRGEGLGRLVTVVMRMATGSWPFLYSKEDDRQIPMSLECCLFNCCSFLPQRMSLLHFSVEILGLLGWWRVLSLFTFSYRYNYISCVIFALTGPLMWQAALWWIHVLLQKRNKEESHVLLLSHRQIFQVCIITKMPHNNYLQSNKCWRKLMHQVDRDKNCFRDARSKGVSISRLENSTTVHL